MNILAIDTSTENLSLALLVSGELFTFNRVVKNQQSIFIIPEINSLLLKAQISVEGLDIITYNQGPGSFTGLRIGLSVVLGIAYAKQIKVIPIAGFYAYLSGLPDMLTKTKLVVAIDARLNQIYLAGIELKNYQYFIQPMLLNPQDIQISSDDNYLFTGNGFNQYYAQLSQHVKSNVFNQNIYPQASNLIDMVRSGKFDVVNIDNLGLLYIRDKVALNVEEQKQLKA